MHHVLRLTWHTWMAGLSPVLAPDPCPCCPGWMRGGQLQQHKPGCWNSAAAGDPAATTLGSCACQVDPGTPPELSLFPLTQVAASSHRFTPSLVIGQCTRVPGSLLRLRPCVRVAVPHQLSAVKTLVNVDHQAAVVCSFGVQRSEPPAAKLKVHQFNR